MRERGFGFDAIFVFSDRRVRSGREKREKEKPEGRRRRERWKKRERQREGGLGRFLLTGPSIQN